MIRAGIILSVEDDAGYDEAFTAAQTGDPDAMNSLGLLLEKWDEREAAMAWFRRAAEAGNPKAIHNVGWLTAKGGDLDAAVPWLHRAIDAGNARAFATLAAVLAQKGDTAEAERLLRSGAELGDDRAIMRLAQTLYHRGAIEEAEHWFVQAAEQGDVKAMLSLARLGRERDDSQGEENWNRRAAEAGDAESMYRLAYSLRTRDDMVGAEEWYRKAADAGSVGAMSGLGTLLMERGERSEAEDWYRRAAASGNKTAMYNLATVLRNRGDLDGAERWYSEALDAGNEGAAEALERLRVKRNETDRWLDAVHFDTLGWSMVTNTEDLRQWKGDAASLSEKYFATAPDIDVLNMEELRSAIREMFHLVETGELRLEDIDVPEEFREMARHRKPDAGELVDLDVFEVFPAHCLSVMVRHRIADHIHYGTQLFVLFADRFWVLALEVEEEAANVGEREVAVAHQLLESGEVVVGESFNPYDRRWDGLIPIESDALTRLRLLSPRIRESLSFAAEALAIPRLEFPDSE